MVIFSEISEIKSYLRIIRKSGKPIGFIPTMGALHQGHISLLKQSKKDKNISVFSIFVNPTQFNDKKDFDKYPNTLKADIEKLKRAGCDILFTPNVKEMYPQGFANKGKLKLGFLAETLEGGFRPGHFDGMVQIVEKLLKVVDPDKLYMGQKDYQQQLIVGQLIKKRGFKTKLVVGSTLREKDGLAMSSRNVRLDKKARGLSVNLSRTLKEARSAIGRTTLSLKEIEQMESRKLAEVPGIELEYFEIRNAGTLKPARSRSEKLVALTAARIGGVRLIDNMLLN